MRHRSKIGMARVAGLGALAACSLLLNLVGPAEGQSPVSNAGDTTREARPGQAAGARGYAGVGQETQMLVAHGLEMAIEGSTLQALASHPGGMIGGSGMGAPRGLRPAPGGDPAAGSRVGTQGTATPGSLGPAGSPVTDATGRSLAGAPGGAIGERPGAPATAVGSRPEAPGIVAGVAAVPMTTGSSAALLRQQAQHSFQDSERLLAQAARDGGADQRLRQAATRYAATLRNFGGGPGGPVPAGAVGNGTGGSGTFPSATSATGVGGTGNPLTGPGGVAVATGAGGVAASGGMADADLTSVAVINHGVKEAIGALRIRQMVRSMGSPDSPAAQSLLTHAREMETQSRAMIQSIATGVGTAPGPVQALAQQANDVILALQGTGG